MQIIIDTANTSITVRNKCFYIQNKTTSRQISPKRISSIAITTNCNINSSAIKLAAHHQVPIYFFNNFGTIQARLWSPYFINLAELRKKQLLFAQSKLASRWIIELLGNKTTEQITNLKKMARQQPKYKEQVIEIEERIDRQFRKIETLGDKKIQEMRNEVMGYEGSVSRLYYQALNLFLPDDFQFNRRSRRPAKDYFNAGLNYIYGMTYSVVESGVFAKGLDPAIGCLHVDSHQNPTLVFDLIEPIRPIIDRILIDLILDGQLNPGHFIHKEQGIWVNKKGKRVIIGTFNDFLHTRINIRGTIKRLKDHIYGLSNDLGNLINEKIELP